MNIASNERFVMVAVPPIPATTEVDGSDGFVVVADAKTGLVRVVKDAEGFRAFDFHPRDSSTQPKK